MRRTLEFIRKGTPYPKVLIVDEPVVYGHELNDLYYQIRRIVRDTVLSLLPDEEEVKRAQYAIWSHMDILTFAQNMDGILLNSSITSHMTAESTMSPLYWRQYIFKATPHNSWHASCLLNIPSYCPKILGNTQSIPSNFRTI